MSGPPRRWLSGFGGFEWHTDDRGFAGLLDALTRDRLETEAVEREMNTSAAASKSMPSTPERVRHAYEPIAGLGADSARRRARPCNSPHWTGSNCRARK